MWKAGRWTGESDEALFASIRYDPAPDVRLSRWIPDAAGQLLFEGEDLGWRDTDEREQRLIDVLQRLRVATGPRASALRGEVRSLGMITWPRLGGPFDVRWLIGLTALEHVSISSHTGIIHASALAELPALRHATLFADARNTLRDLDGIAQSRSLESLDLRYGSLGNLRALSGLGTLRRLRIHESQAYSIAGIEDLPLEELEIDVGLPDSELDFTALTALRSLRSLTARGRLSLATAKAIARCRASVLRFPFPTDRQDPAAIAALPDAEEVSFTPRSLDTTTGWMGRLPVTDLSVAHLDDAALRLLAHAPRLRALRVHQLDATSLEPLAELPALRELRFNIARKLRSLDRVPEAVLLADLRTPDWHNWLDLQKAPLVSLRQIGHLRGVEHLDLRGCKALTSLAGVEGLHELRSIDLRDCPQLRDLSALEALPVLQAVLVNHRGPPEPFPPGIQERVARSNLKALIQQLHREALARRTGASGE